MVVMQIVTILCYKIQYFMASVTLRNIPDKEFEHIKKVQFAHQLKKKSGTYSKEATIIQIIKEHREAAEKKKD